MHSDTTATTMPCTHRDNNERPDVKFALFGTCYVDHEVNDVDESNPSSFLNWARCQLCSEVFSLQEAMDQFDYRNDPSGMSEAAIDGGIEEYVLHLFKQLHPIARNRVLREINIEWAKGELFEGVA